MTISKLGFKSEDPDPDVVVIACIAYGKIIDPSYNDAILRVLVHFTGDENINLNNMKVAIKFCGPRLLNGRARFLTLHRSVFTMLAECFSSITDKKQRKKILAAYRKAVSRQTVRIYKPHMKIKSDWEKFKLYS